MKIKVYYRAVVAMILFFSLGYANAQPIKDQTVKDADGNVYNLTKIGPRIWTARNLDVSHFRNGDPIPQAKSAAEWQKAGHEGKPAWCYYGNDTANGRKYGKLYNYYAITDPRGLAPEGWRVPGNEDWRTLTSTLGTVDLAGTKLKNPKGWSKKDFADDKSGYSGLPGGLRDSTGTFRELGVKAQWWSTSGAMRGSKQIYSLFVLDTSVETIYETMNKESGLSVRCVKNEK